MRKHRIVHLFESRRGHLDSRVKRDYISKGIATIPCRVSDYYDIIRTYSIKGFETLNTDFVDYIKVSAEVIPSEYPLVLEFVEDFLSKEEKKTIEETVRDYFAYNLGMVEKDLKRHTKRFILMCVGLVLSGILLWLSQEMAEVPREMFFILFWFLGDTLCDYIFLTGYDLRKDKRTAGRLASVKVEFSKSFDESDYTKKEVDNLYSEIEKDIKETLE